MAVEQVDDALKENIWRRDDFTCGLCGKMIPWEEVVIVRKKRLKGSKGNDPDNLMLVCAYCVEETGRAPEKEVERRHLRRLLRELMSYTDFSQEVIFEEDYEEEVIRLSGKIEEMRNDNKLLSDAMQEKEKLAIAYKVKMDRALKDLENYRNRTENEVRLKVRDRTKELYLEMIRTLDSIDRAIAEARKDGELDEVLKVIDGLEFIRKGLMGTLEKNGVIVIDPVNQPFDPREHESMGIVEDKELYADTVVKVEMKGFKLDDLILRPAGVWISRGGPKRTIEMEEEIVEFDVDEEAVDAGETSHILEVGDWDGEIIEESVVRTRKKKGGGNVKRKGRKS